MINLIDIFKKKIQKKIVKPRSPWTPSLTLVIFAAIISIAPPAVFLALRGPDSEKRTDAGYAMLVLDEEQNDREICALLKKHNINNYRSESTEWFLLNDFSGIQKIPLDEYPARLESFDPRNDGYAEKARAVFVREGRRRIFIPVEGLGGFGPASPEAKIIDALEGTAYSSIHFQSVRRNPVANTVIFIIACIFLLLAAWKIASVNREPYIALYAILFIPSLALLAGSGAAGFALAALCLGYFQTLRKPILFFLARKRYEKKPPLKFAAPEVLELFRFEKPNGSGEGLLAEKWTIIPLAALFFGICIAGRIPALTVVCFGLFFTLAFVSVLAAEAMRGRLSRHIPFTFVSIRSASYQKTKYPSLPVPFLAALIIQIIVSSFTGAGAALSLDFPDLGKDIELPDKNDWERHLETQQSFGLRNLNTVPENTQNYFHYSLGEDGLIKSAEIDRHFSVAREEAPRWALGELIAFIQGTGKTGVTPPRPASGTAVKRADSLLVGFFALCIYIPFIFQRSFQRHRKRLPCLLLYNN
jgi:hypothetical protein